MPYADEEFNNDDPNLLFRLLLYGPEKVKKTWWACAAAEAGFNVILLDSDDGAHIIKQISPEARKRIFHLNIVDMIERPIACHFMARFMSGKKFIWNETEKTVCLTKSALKEGCKYIECDILKLTKNDILVNDSWTKLTRSLIWRWYQENNVDISSGDQAKQSDWPGYRWSGALAYYFLRQGLAVNSHWINIGHQTVYEKHKTVTIGGKKQDIIEWSRTQIQSTSGPNAMGVGGDFSDILRFKLTGDICKIITTAEEGFLGGARLIPPGTYKWQDLQFRKICEMNNIPLPIEAARQTALIQIDIEKVEEELAKENSNLSNGLITTKSKPAKGSFGDLLKKQKGKENG